MVIVQFGSDDARRACCDLASMRRRWGPDAARSVSRRLQQIEAMESLADLAFLPFDYHERDGGLFEVAVTDQLVLVIEHDHATQPGGPMNTTMVTVTGIRDRAARTRTS